MQKRIEQLEKKIEDVKKRWPAHSVKPEMVQELEDLEEELKKLKEEFKNGKP